MAIPTTIEGREYTSFVECNGSTAKRVKVCQQAGETIKVEFDQAGQSINSYNEILSLAGLASANVVLYTVPVGNIFTLSRIDFSGENKATYKVDINGSIQAKKRTWYIDYNGEIIFNNINLVAGDIIKLIVENNSNSIANFNANIQGRLTNA